ncbi:uncharacterized protein LOC106097071 isoform X2 [Oreochromis niloticus]|uniref:uncharacterized protein LOC106097071 isoform X2 n=1 Tax=Oreochromis niloticus TaxID=8128 RepID=UPI000DF201F3|nr:uncharacterized protein LOC106097071 isoform X2 [Oreochromis niloticus]
MTTVTFVFLTLFIWVLSCDTWLNLDQYEHYEETKAFAALCKNVAIHDNDNTKLTQTCDRISEMSVGSNNIFTQEIKTDCTVYVDLALNCMASNGCVHLLQEYRYTVKEDKESKHVHKCRILQFLVYLLSKTNCVLHVTQMSSKVYSTHYPKEVFLTPADGVRVTVYTGKIVQPTDSSKWVGKIFQAALLLFAMHMTRIDMSSSRVSLHHNCNFSPSVNMYQPSQWCIILACLTSVVGRTVHVLIIFKAAHPVMKLSFSTHYRLNALLVTVLLIWLTFSIFFLNNNMKHMSKDLLIEGTDGSALRSWGVLRQIELLATLCCVLVSLSSLRQSILTKVSFLSILFHVQLVTCHQNSRIPTKYLLIVKINRLI